MKWIVVLVAICTLSSGLYAETYTQKGYIKEKGSDTHKGGKLSGVKIKVKNRDAVYFSGKDGSFTLDGLDKVFSFEEITHNMKKFFAVLLCMAMLLSGITVSYAAELGIFSDVDVTSDEGIAILTLYVEGIVKGYGDGTFGVDKPLTRAEFSRMINLVFGYEGTAENKFTDVKADDWFYNDVLTAIAAGYIAGFEDNTFRGNDNVTRQQVCSVVNRIIKAPEQTNQIAISDKIDNWAEFDVHAIVDNGYMKTEAGDIFRATENITRGELALLLAQFVDDSDYTVEVPEQNIDDEKTDSSTGSNGSDSSSGNSSGGSSSRPSNGSTSRPSGSGGSRPSGGSSGGSGSDDKEEPDVPQEPVVPEEPVDNTEVLAYLKKVLNDINSATFVGKEDEMIGYIKASIEATIAAGESGEKLTDDYVMVHFDSEVKKVKGIYNGMSEEERDAFIMKIAAFDMETLAYLQEYFLE